MIRFFILIAAFIAFIPSQAQASYWLECKVHAKVRLNLDTGFYKAEINGAKVSDGHDKKGSACMKDKIGKTIKIKIKGNPPEGKTIRLKYKLFNAMGSDGVVNEESWRYWPPSLKDVLPW